MSEKYNWAEDPRPVCIVPDGGFASLKDIGDCKFAQDYTGIFISFSQKIHDKKGRPLDGDYDPKAKIYDQPKTDRKHKKVEKKEIKEKVASEQQTLVASVQVPSQPVDIPKPQNKADMASSYPLLTAAIIGAVSSAAGPMAANFLKSLFNNLLKSNKSTTKEQKEQPTDCKTSQIKAFSRFKTLEGKVAALENKNNTQGGNIDNANIDELIERIEKLEKKMKQDY